jgi:hypothetical protein
MTLDALDITKEQLFENEDLLSDFNFIFKNNLKQYPEEKLSKEFTSVKSREPIHFTSTEHKSATSQNIQIDLNNSDLERAALRGTLVHKALELFWNRLDDDSLFENLFIKEAVTDITLQDEIKKLSRNFKQTNIFTQLQAGAEHIFEFEFEETIDNELHRGSIDLLLKNPDDSGWTIIDFKSGKKRDTPEYEAQLEFYKKVMEYKKLEILASEICWLG